MNDKSSNSLKLAVAVSIIIILLLIYLPAPAFSQRTNPPGVQDLIVNGGFEGGFQEEYGIGYGWGGFSNGNAVVGWNFDDWEPVVVDGQYSQRIEIKDALEADRYAGIYQTISVVPGEQYKLTIKGLIRSEEGDIDSSNYGYRLQYAVDQNGGASWELVDQEAWQELPWDEQAMAETDTQYDYKTYQTTITAESDRLTLFIRGWKKWINDGEGMFNLDEISLVGPGPEGFQAPVAEVASVAETDSSTTVSEADNDQALVQVSEHDADLPDEEVEPEPAEEAVEPQAAPQPEEEPDSTTSETEMEEAEESTTTTQEDSSSAQDAPAEMEEPSQTEPPARMDSSSQPEGMPSPEDAPLPVSGFGDGGSVIYVLIFGVALLLVLFVGAVSATVRRQAKL